MSNLMQFAKPVASMPPLLHMESQQPFQPMEHPSHVAEPEELNFLPPNPPEVPMEHPSHAEAGEFNFLRSDPPEDPMAHFNRLNNWPDEQQELQPPPIDPNTNQGPQQNQWSETQEQSSVPLTPNLTVNNHASLLPVASDVQFKSTHSQACQTTDEIDLRNSARMSAQALQIHQSTQTEQPELVTTETHQTVPSEQPAEIPVQNQTADFFYSTVAEQLEAIGSRSALQARNIGSATNNEKLRIRLIHLCSSNRFPCEGDLIRKIEKVIKKYQ